MNSSLVSVIIPAYNAAWCIRRAVDSVLVQAWQAFEIIVIDDGSSDDTLDVLAAYGTRLRVLSQANGGPSLARNRGLRAASGHYVAFLDADDHWLPDKLACQVALLDAHPEIGFCSTATRIVDPQGMPLRDWSCCHSEPLLEILFIQGAAVSGSTSGVMARRELLLEAGSFDEKLHGFEDPDLWMRLAARTSYVCIPEVLTVVVRTPGSVSGNLSAMCAATLASYIKNRALLPGDKRGRYWRAACAGVLADYAKGAYRLGQRTQATAWLFRALWLSPWRRGRLVLSLLLAMLMGATLD